MLDAGDLVRVDGPLEPERGIDAAEDHRGQFLRNAGGPDGHPAADQKSGQRRRDFHAGHRYHFQIGGVLSGRIITTTHISSLFKPTNLLHLASF